MNEQPVNTSTARIVLASASPRRRELLAQIGIQCFIHALDLDESILPEETAELYVQRLAIEKARQAKLQIHQNKRLAGLPVLGSDTSIELHGEILGKPLDSAHAAEILAKLSGNTHVVHTAVALATNTGLLTAISGTQVTFSTLSEEQIAMYVATGESLDKAGAYAIQGQAAQFVRQLNGSYSGVMGLPLFETAELLRQANINPLAAVSG